MVKEPQEKVGPLFPDEERRRIVRSFIDAYLRGSVKIVQFGKDKGSQHESRCVFLDQIALATGTRNVDPDRVNRAINNLFEFVVASRIGERIEGEFLEVPIDFASRLAKLENALENEVKSLSRILSLILQWIRTYQPVLDEAAKDYTGKLGRIRKLDRRD